ncbi:luciferase-type oxidoreductase [compost metagenome]|jgi:luciferase-type oxidoreductase
MTAPATVPTEVQIPADLARHRAYAAVFHPERLTFGFIAPLEGYPDAPGPTLNNHAALARKVDDAGFSAIWLRDVPFYDPGFGDVGQVIDPMVYAGFLAAVTGRIAIGTAGIVLPLRDPLIVAKQAASVDQLLGGRFLLGLASGDRPTEYPAFGVDFENRAERFRDAVAIIRAATETAFPVLQSKHYGHLSGNIDLVPKPAATRLPLVVIGYAGQSVEWIAQNTDGVIWYLGNFSRLPDILARWRAAGDGRTFKPYGYGTFFDLDADPNAPIQSQRVLRAGRNTLIELWKRQQDAGVSHVALNLKPLRRPAIEVLDELADYVLPHFPTHDVTDAGLAA